MTKIKSINIVCSHYFPHTGGVERFALLQAREFLRLGYMVNVITHDTESCGYYEKNGNLRIYRLRCKSLLKNNRIPMPVSFYELKRVYHDCFNNDSTLTIVHTRYFLLCIIAACFARLAKQHLVLLDHSSSYIELGGPFLNFVCRIYEHVFTACLKLFRPVVLGVSQACNVWLEQLGVKTSGVYYNGLDFSETVSSTVSLKEIFPIGDRKIVLLVGRLLKEKGAVELVEGFRLFVKDNREFVLVIVGRGELEASLRALSEDVEQFFFAGERKSEEVYSFMSQSDIFVNPSNYPEGLPTVLLEAGRAGMLVISTPNGGAKEVIIHGETGLIIPRGKPNYILQALDLVSHDPVLCQRLSLNLKNKVTEEFDFSKITKIFIEQHLKDFYNDKN